MVSTSYTWLIAGPRRTPPGRVLAPPRDARPLTTVEARKAANANQKNAVAAWPSRQREAEPRVTMLELR